MTQINSFKLKTILAVFITCLIINSYAENPLKTNNKKRLEITSTDITLYNKHTARDISVFGIHLSMTINDVKKIVDNKTNIYLEKDAFNPNRYYLYDQEKVYGKPVILAYLIWGDDKSNLKEITLYHGIIKYLVGESKKLLTYDVIIKDSYIVRFYMGYPSKKKIIIDIPIINMRSTAFYFPHKDFKVTKNVSEYVVTFTLSLMLDIFDNKS